MGWDFQAVLWKELTALRRVYRRPASYLSTGMYVLFFGVFPALFLRADFVMSPLTLFYLTLAPLVTGSGMATLAFAGERENHTLETLLASRLTERGILLGKVAANALYAWMYVAVCLLAGWLVSSLSAGRLLSYVPAVLWGGLLIGLLTAWMAASLGTLASLRAATVKDAGRRLGWVYLLFMVPYFVLSFIPQAERHQLLLNFSRSDTGLIVLVASLLLIAVNLGALWAAQRQFQRQQLILD